MTSPAAGPVTPSARFRAGRSVNGLALQLSAVALSFILVALLVVTSSRAAFVAQTDTDSGTAMFDNVTQLAPGTTVDRCIDVTYSGSVDPTAVLLYATSAPTGNLAQYLNLTVDIGADSPDAFRSCTNFAATSTLYTGTLAGFASTHQTYATGLVTWDPATSPQTRTFRFRISVQNNPAAEGQTAGFGFTWETRTS
jgi:hypothetical protein